MQSRHLQWPPCKSRRPEGYCSLHASLPTRIPLGRPTATALIILLEALLLEELVPGAFALQVFLGAASPLWYLAVPMPSPYRRRDDQGTASHRVR